MEIARNGVDARAKCIAIAFGAGQLEREPMISDDWPRRIGVQQNPFPAEDHDEGIGPAVVVIVSKGRAPADLFL